MSLWGNPTIVSDSRCHPPSFRFERPRIGHALQFGYDTDKNRAFRALVVQSAPAVLMLRPPFCPGHGCPMSREIDALTSSTLRHLRDRWWNDAFTAFLEDTLRPRPGKRILDVGCGTGTGEVSLSRLRMSQMQLYGVDLVLQRLRQALEATRGANARASYAAADACRLPFRTGVFDSTYCVAVLQHIRDLGLSLGEIARVTKPNGRILVVEPDNQAIYWFSSAAKRSRRVRDRSSVLCGARARPRRARGHGRRPARARPVRRQRDRAAVGAVVPRVGRARGRAARFAVADATEGRQRRRGQRAGRIAAAAGERLPQGHRPLCGRRANRRIVVRRDPEHPPFCDGGPADGSVRNAER